MPDSTTNPLASLAAADLAQLLGVIVTAANNIHTNPTSYNAITQILAIPTNAAQVVPAIETFDIGNLAAYISQLATEKQAELTADAAD